MPPITSEQLCKRGQSCDGCPATDFDTRMTSEIAMIAHFVMQNISKNDQETEFLSSDFEAQRNIVVNISADSQSQNQNVFDTPYVTILATVLQKLSGKCV